MCSFLIPQESLHLVVEESYRSQKLHLNLKVVSIWYSFPHVKTWLLGNIPDERRDKADTTK